MIFGSFRWLAACALLAAPAIAEPLRIGTESDFRPYIFMNDQGQRDGYDVELANLICDAGGFDCTWIEVPFTGLISGVALGQFDIAIGGIGSTPERDLLVDWTRHYRTIEEGRASFAGLSQDIDPATARVGVLQASTQMDALIDNGYAPIGFVSNQAAIDALFAGKIDAFFGSRLYLGKLVEAGETRLFDLGTLTYDDAGPQIAVAKGNDALRLRLNDLLDSLDSGGELTLIGAKWFPDTQPADL